MRLLAKEKSYYMKKNCFVAAAVTAIIIMWNLTFYCVTKKTWYCIDERPIYTREKVCIQ